jgi:hypothetical protein
MGEFHLRFVVARCGEKDQCEPALFAVMAPEFNQAELVAVEIERFVDVCHAHHGVEVFHRLPRLKSFAERDHNIRS